MEVSFPNKYEYYTYEEFLILQKEETRFKIEYDNVFIFSMPSAHPDHDRVKNKIATAFINHLGFGGMYEVFTSDIAVVFENQDEIYEFQPDIKWCCNSKLFHEPKYKGIPRLFVEILSYSTEHRDRTIKLSVYEKFQVPEYSIVGISNECIEVYSNNINGKYCSINKCRRGMKIKVFDELVLDVDEIFSVIK